MFINELAEPRLIVIYPGRFQPFHKGHHAVYEWLTGKFGRNNVWIATSNKVDGDRSPFNFAEKSYFMQLTGVPGDRIIQASNPYQIENILSTGQITVADPNNTVVIFAVSEKDMAEDPRFSFKPKKDGSDSYFQPLKDIKNTVPMNQHGYIMTVPTFDFHVNNEPMRSASQLRASYAEADPEQRQKIIADLFGRYSREAEQIMNSKIPQTAKIAEAELPAAQLNKLYQYKNQLAQQAQTPEPTSEPVAEPDPVTQGDLATLQQRRQKLDTILNLKKELEALIPRAERTWGGMDRGTRADVELDYPTPTTDKEYDELIALYTKQVQQLKNYIQRKRAIYKEDAAGVGVVKNSKDPRYMTATMGDQNDVTGDTLGKMMKAYRLTGVKSPKTGQKPIGKDIGKGLKESEQFNRSGYNKLRDRKDFLDKRDHLQKLLINPAIPYQDKDVIKQRLLDLQYAAKQQGLDETREPYQQAIDKLSLHYIQKMADEIDEITQRLNTEKLSPEYKQILKDKIEKLKVARAKLLFDPK